MADYDSDLWGAACEYVNTGDARAYPTVTVKGPCTSAEFYSPFNRKWKWTGVLGVNDTLTVDHSRGTVVDQTGLNRYNELSPAPRFWWVPPGESVGHINLTGCKPGTWQTKGPVLFKNLVHNPVAWTGDSTVRERRRNYVINPSMEGSGGWTGIGNAGLTYDTAEKVIHTRSLKVGPAVANAPVYASQGVLGVGTGRTSTAVPVPSGVAAGDIVIVHLYQETVAAITPPTGFALAMARVDGSGTTNFSQYVYWKRATGADTGTYNFTHATSTTSAAASRYTGVVSTGTPFEVIGSGRQTSSSTVALSGSTSGANRLLVFGATMNGGGTWTPPSGFTERYDSPFVTFATKTQATAGATGTVQAVATVSAENTDTLIALIPPTVVTGGDYGASSAATVADMAPVVPGQKVTASVEMKRVASAVDWVQLGIVFYDYGGAQLSSPTTTVGPSNTVFTRFYTTQTAPAGAQYASLFVYLQSTSTGVWIDRALLEIGNQQLPYFDGLATDIPEITYDWVGTTHASFSTASSKYVTTARNNNGTYSGIPHNLADYSGAFDGDSLDSGFDYYAWSDQYFPTGQSVQLSQAPKSWSLFEGPSVKGTGSWLATWSDGGPDTFARVFIPKNSGSAEWRYVAFAFPANLINDELATGDKVTYRMRVRASAASTRPFTIQNGDDTGAIHPTINAAFTTNWTNISVQSTVSAAQGPNVVFYLYLPNDSSTSDRWWDITELAVIPGNYPYDWNYFDGNTDLRDYSVITGAGYKTLWTGVEQDSISKLYEGELVGQTGVHVTWQRRRWMVI